ncbi:MAG: helix-turn-helix transcriptional regulator, partial [Caldilineaceae bacterium]|nr:helix-turn-helix transcriptional regulator [Caldilineaceae bacterium]
MAPLSTSEPRQFGAPAILQHYLTKHVREVPHESAHENENWGLTHAQTHARIRTVFGNKEDVRQVKVMTEELTTRERRALRTREAILDAARQIISRQGADALSMRAIAKAIDYSPAGLYE